MPSKNPAQRLRDMDNIDIEMFITASQQRDAL
jgi:hypothetical protein